MPWLLISLSLGGVFSGGGEPPLSVVELPYDERFDVGAQKRTVIGFDVLADDLQLEWFVGLAVGSEVGFCIMDGDQATTYLENGATQCKLVGKVSEGKKQDDVAAFSAGQYAVGLHCRSVTEACDVTVRLATSQAPA